MRHQTSPSSLSFNTALKVEFQGSRVTSVPTMLEGRRFEIDRPIFVRPRWASWRVCGVGWRGGSTLHTRQGPGFGQMRCHAAFASLFKQGYTEIASPSLRPRPCLRHSVGPAKAHRRADGSEARGRRCVMAGARRTPNRSWNGVRRYALHAGSAPCPGLCEVETGIRRARCLLVGTPGAQGPKCFATPRIPMRSSYCSTGTTWRMLTSSLSRRTCVRRCSDLALMDNLTSPTWMTMSGNPHRDLPNV